MEELLRYMNVVRHLWNARYDEEFNTSTVDAADVVACYKRNETPSEACDSLRMYYLARKFKAAVDTPTVEQTVDVEQPVEVNAVLTSPVLPEPLTLQVLDTNASVLEKADIAAKMLNHMFHIHIERSNSAAGFSDRIV